MAGAEKLQLELDLPYTQFLVDRDTADADYAAEARQLLIGHALDLNDAANIRITADQLASSITESANAAAVQGHAGTVASSLSSGTQAIAGSLGSSGTALASAIQSYQQAEAQIQATHRTATQQAEREFQHDEDNTARDAAIATANETRDDALKTLREAYVTQEITLDGAHRVKVASEQLAHTNNVGQSRISTTTTIAGNLRDYLHDAADRDESFAHDMADLVVGLGENLAEERLAAHDAIFALDDTPWGIRHLAEEVAAEDFMLTVLPAAGVLAKEGASARRQEHQDVVDAAYDRVLSEIQEEVEREVSDAGAAEVHATDHVGNQLENVPLVMMRGDEDQSDEEENEPNHSAEPAPGGSSNTPEKQVQVPTGTSRQSSPNTIQKEEVVKHQPQTPLIVEESDTSAVGSDILFVDPQPMKMSVMDTSGRMLEETLSKRGREAVDLAKGIWHLEERINEAEQKLKGLERKASGPYKARTPVLRARYREKAKELERLITFWRSDQQMFLDRLNTDYQDVEIPPLWVENGSPYRGDRLKYQGGSGPLAALERAAHEGPSSMVQMHSVFVEDALTVTGVGGAIKGAVRAAASQGTKAMVGAGARQTAKEGADLFLESQIGISPISPLEGMPKIGKGGGPSLPAGSPNKSVAKSVDDVPGPGHNQIGTARQAGGGRTGRGNQAAFADEAEQIVSDATGVPRNLQGPGQQTIPGSGPGGVRVPDLNVRGPKGSVRLRGSVVEVKASRGTKFGDLSQRSRDQIRDAVDYVRILRDKARLVNDPQTKQLLRNSRVEIFSDLPAPTRGEFADLINQGFIEWKPIPR